MSQKPQNISQSMSSETSSTASAKSPKTKNSSKKTPSVRVLVTRPQAAAGPLVECLKKAGYDAVSLPMVGIEPIEVDAATRQRTVVDLDLYHHVIAVSPNAAQLGLSQMESYWPQWPVQQHWYGVGKKTVSVIQQFDLEPTCPQDRYDSEGLLALESLSDLEHQKVLILRGEGGRELLAETLKARGATVTYLELYRRVPIHYSASEVLSVLQSPSIDVVVVSSGEILQQWILTMQTHGLSYEDCKLLVPSDRVAQLARHAGVQDVYNCGGADNEAVLMTLNKMTNRNSK